MDVKEITGGTLFGMNGGKGKQEELEESNFQRLLEEAQANRNQAGGRILPGAFAEKSEFPEVAGLFLSPANLTSGFTEPSTLQSQGIRAAEKALGLLEQYQRIMADPEISLREAGPLVESLSRELENLGKLADSLSSSDPLRQIITHVGILSSVEMEKFARGEYI
jgi:hypothetical protein